MLDAGKLNPFLAISLQYGTFSAFSNDLHFCVFQMAHILTREFSTRNDSNQDVFNIVNELHSIYHKPTLILLSDSECPCSMLLFALRTFHRNSFIWTTLLFAIFWNTMICSNKRSIKLNSFSHFAPFNAFGVHLFYSAQFRLICCRLLQAIRLRCMYTRIDTVCTTNKQTRLT